MSFGGQARARSMASRPRRRRRRSGAAAAGLLAAVLIAGAALWLWEQTRLDRFTDRLLAEAARQGWQVQIGDQRRAGWPWAVRRVLRDVRLAPPAGPAAGLVWTGERLVLELDPLDASPLRLRLGGLQTLGGPDAPLGRRLRLEVADLLLTPLRPARADAPCRLGIRATGGMRVALPGSAALRIDGLSGLLLWTRPGAPGAGQHDGQALSLHAARLALSGVKDAPMAMSLSLALPGPRGAPGLAWAERLRGWQQGGGRLLLEEAVLRLPDSRITLAGTARLDANLSAYGDFTLRLRGADRLIDRLARDGELDRAEARAVHAVLGLITDADEPPAAASRTRPPPEIALPLDLRDGLLSLGRIPLLRLAPPAAPPP